MDVRHHSNSEIAYAKINLALHILERKEDGYHNIDTIFAFANHGDNINVESSDRLILSINGPFADELGDDINDNLVMKTARLIQQKFNIKDGALIHLQKKLPIASGIGGGSADAAAIARLLNRFWVLNLSHQQLADIVAPLGADIPACVYSHTMRGTGIGNDLEMISDKFDIKNVPILLINPLVSISTATIFKAWDGVSSGPLRNLPLNEIMESTHNDMQRAAISLFPEVNQVLNALQNERPILHRMSGSGATCFALFENNLSRDNAMHEIKVKYPQWWFLSSNLK